MGEISKAKRFRILARDGFRCRYCGRKAPDVELHVDHIMARAAGGRNEDGNLASSCFDCNAGKSDRRLSGPVNSIGVVNRRGRTRLKTDQRSRMPRLVRKDEPHHHVLNTGEVDALGTEFGEDQAASLWCESHRRFEWHRVPKFVIGSGTLERFGPELTTFPPGPR